MHFVRYILICLLTIYLFACGGRGTEWQGGDGSTNASVFKFNPDLKVDGDTKPGDWWWA